MLSVPVTEASQVAETRRRAVTMAQGLGFDETAAGRVAIVATELATNLVKYGTAGEVLIGTFEDETGTGIELLALDRGAGFPNVDDALRDGHSTGGSAGTGLGAVRRQSQAFDVISWPGRGTAVVARLQKSVAASAAPQATVGAVTVPLKGETANGDAYCVRRRGDGWTAIVADGLGHGPLAAQASDQAVRLFRKHEDAPPGAILAAMHAGLGHTRGGAVSVARYDPDRAQVTFAGIGNVAGAAVGAGGTKRTVSLPGTAGHVARRIQEFEYRLDPDGLFVMCSDGIGTAWALEAYPGLIGAHPSLIAGVLYRDFTRVRDDATVVVIRNRPA
ncbi:SpoIIE family protein phosphatase [Methylobacterium sp. J-026]|uniref:SpoIIE family protein phosphatase n=1 Tax=Methylobacterium sp. J-026 TaxID=2836624 RepID=UPI001FBA68E3|nr:SpoIIE family protein phosphatase [Methylobacterium sp. J-026]MCJ2136423.1 SpoIIE family protein phosphatase [Methylobacterium sp. J-026]